MNLTQRLAHIALGGVLVTIGMIMSPLTAQNDKFREIECTSLTVVNPDTGKSIIELAFNGLGGEINISDLTGNRQLSLFGTGILNALNIYGHSGEPVVAALSDGSGGLITVANDVGSAAGKAAAGIAASKTGNGGILELYDNTGKVVITLKATEYGSSASFANKEYNPGVIIEAGALDNYNMIVVGDDSGNPIATLP